MAIPYTKPTFVNDAPPALSASLLQALVDVVKTLADGAVVVDANNRASVSGIIFPATAVPSAEPNTLDDYEEGTWTPTLTFGGASVGIAYSAIRSGRYTKIGDRVFFTAIFSITNKGSSVGNAQISGLPFLANGGDAALAPCAIVPNGVTFADVPLARVAQGAAIIDLFETTNSGVRATLTDADFGSASSMSISGHYHI